MKSAWEKAVLQASFLMLFFASAQTSAASSDPLAGLIAEAERGETGEVSREPSAETSDLDRYLATHAAEKSGYYGIRLSDLQQKSQKNAVSERPRIKVPQGKASDDQAPETVQRVFEGAIPQSDASLTREDGGVKILTEGPVHLIGFYGYGGLTRGEGYQFQGTGFAGTSGTSRVIPMALSLAGYSADPRLNIYSAEMRAEAPIALGKGAELVPFAGYRAIVTQDADQGILSEFGGGSTTGADGRDLQQLPVGIGMRLTRQADAKTVYRLNGMLGAVTNFGDTYSVYGLRPSAEGLSVSGVGAVGVEVEKGPWSFGAGADFGVAEGDRSEKGFSINAKRRF